MLERARDDSAVLRGVRQLRLRTRTALERSRLGRVAGFRPTARVRKSAHAAENRVSDPSAPQESAVPARLDTVRAGSAIGSAATNATSRLEAGISNAAVASLGQRLRRYVTSSFCYRWLTTEPEPDVIVIDLRETRSVGPAIGLVDRSLGALSTATPTSTLADAVTPVGAAVRSRPLAVAAGFAFPAIVVSLLALATTGVLSPALLVVHLLAGLAAAVGLRSRRSLEELRETRTAALLAAAFEPPEPPEPAGHTVAEPSEDEPGPSAGDDEDGPAVSEDDPVQEPSDGA